MTRIIEIENWRTRDAESNLLFPWYTRPFINEMISWDISNWKVFEYGAGDSTTWWRIHAKNVYSVDTDQNWASKVCADFVSEKQEFLSYPMKLIDHDLFDCIIIDGDPVSWRDECAEVAIRCIKNNGIIIADNYNQATIPGLANWPKTDETLKMFKKHIYKEPSHVDWTTAYWRIEIK